MKSNNQQSSTNNSYPDELLSVPTKICDGIFMADELISQDVQWLQMNQVTHIINCAGKHCKNSNKMNAVNFLTYEWSENNIQNIIEQNVIGAAISFIQQAKKQCGSVLVHCYQSQSRPFCILASYLMIRYQWNLFKTLEFLNSRKQDIELEPAFFQQLTSLHQKLQQKGLIKSRTWNREDYMTEEEIILTNTFLNSRKRNNEPNKIQPKTKKSQNKGKKIYWKQSTNQTHVYHPQTIIADLNPKTIVFQSQQQPQYQPHTQLQPQVQLQMKENQKIPKDSNSSKYNQQESQRNILVNSKQNLQNTKQTKAINEQNVTKRWAELRQAWTKEKQNNPQLQNQSEQKTICNLKVEKPLNANSNNFLNQQKEQKISDRIQEKLNIIKNGYETKSVSTDIIKRRDHTPITGKKIKSNSTNQKNEVMRRVGQTVQRVSLIEKKNHQNFSNEQTIEQSNQNQRPQFYQINKNASSSNKQVSKVPKTNTKNNFTLNDSRTNAQSSSYTNTTTNASMIISQVKQMGNKSVLIVKPNQFGNSTNDANNLSQSRNSKKKISESNDNKENRYSLNKDTSLMRQSSLNEITQMRNSKVSNFFRMDNMNSKNNNQAERTTKRVDNSMSATRISQSLLNNKGTSSLSKKGSSSCNSVMSKMRSSSTRVSRKQEIPSSNTSISKNYSYTSKGKWKM